MTPTRPQILSRLVDDAAALASSTGLLSGWRSPCFPNLQAASLAWKFGKHFAVSAALSSALRRPNHHSLAIARSFVGLLPHTLPEVAGLGRLPTLGLRLCSNAPACCPRATPSEMLTGRMPKAPRRLGGSGIRPVRAGAYRCPLPSGSQPRSPSVARATALRFTYRAFAFGCSPNARGGSSQFPNGA